MDEHKESHFQLEFPRLRRRDSWSSIDGNLGYPKYCDKEIETFAREIFAHNTWLLESYETAERPVGANEKGERGVSVKRRKVTFPRNEGERDSDYLVRAVHRHMTEQARHRQRLFQSIDSIGPQLGATINSLSVNLGVLRPIRSF